MTDPLIRRIRRYRAISLATGTMIVALGGLIAHRISGDWTPALWALGGWTPIVISSWFSSWLTERSFRD